MSVFVQYSALAAATAVQCELRLGIVMLPALFILFRIFVFPLYFHVDFRVVVSVSMEKAIGILVRIALNLEMALGIWPLSQHQFC